MSNAHISQVGNNKIRSTTPMIRIVLRYFFRDVTASSKSLPLNFAKLTAIFSQRAGYIIIKNAQRQEPPNTQFIMMFIFLLSPTFGVTRELVGSDSFGTHNRQINCRTPSGPCPGWESSLHRTSSHYRILRVPAGCPGTAGNERAFLSRLLPNSKPS